MYLEKAVASQYLEPFSVLSESRYVGPGPASPQKVNSNRRWLFLSTVLPFPRAVMIQVGRLIQRVRQMHMEKAVLVTV